MDFSGKQVVVTGGTGALGTSVVSALIGAGATCTVPYVHDAEAERFPYRGQPQATLIKVFDLSEEAEVAKVYAGVKSLWASIHIAGGFAAAKITDIDKTALMAQIDSNLTSCFLCCRAAVKAMVPAGGGRIVNVAARPALEPRSGAGMTAYTVAKAGVAALTMALAEEVAKAGVLVNAVAPSIMDT
ncbi:MAG: SDR family NAD(P)-dependent oxidoreductase, partial [Pseudolabrys sp.]